MRGAKYRRVRRAAPLALAAGVAAWVSCGVQTDLSPFAPPRVSDIDFTVFGPDFMWGAATSSHQVEGGDVDSDWWKWEHLGKIKTGEVSGDAADHWNRYREDLDALVALNLDTFRFSFSWARLFPRAEMTEPDPAAVAHYDDVFAAMGERGIRPLVTLFHFVSPAWVTDAGRWESGAAVDDYLRLVRFVVTRYADRVDWWLTMNEPEVFVFQGWLNGVFPPGKQDGLLATKVLLNVMRAHAEAYYLIHELDSADADGDGRPVHVGIAKLLAPMEAFSRGNPIEEVAAGWLNFSGNSYWLLANNDIWTPLPGYNPPAELRARFRHTLDFIGVNYFSRVLLRFDLLRGFSNDQRPGVPRSTLGFEVYPPGLYLSLQFMSAFGLPIIVTENGLADGEDSHREAFIIGHLAELSRFMKSNPGTPVLGYVHWALTDNFEWENGYPPRFGLYAVDYSTQQRTKRPSATRFAEIVARAKGLPPSPARVRNGSDLRTPTRGEPRNPRVLAR